MKRFFASVLVALLVSIGIAQSTRKALLLEANTLGIGMASPQGKHLYLRVYSDGRVEYESERMVKARLEYFTQRSILSAREIKELSDYLNDRDVQALAKEYPPIEIPIDHAIDLTVAITRTNRTQTIVVRNFSPTSPRASGAYPTSLIGLLCKIERLRKNASFGITADTDSWCKR
jgi:hypothetical protein